LQPIQDVREVLVTAVGQGKVEEIEILGPPPAGVNLSSVTPDAEEVPTPGYAQWEASATQRNALNRLRADMAIAQLRTLRTAVDRAIGLQNQAQAWFELNRMADHIAILLERDESAKPLLESLEPLGATFYWCDPSGQWAAGTAGYETYLRSWPDGPRADDAWMAVHRFEGPLCGDFEGMLDEYEGLIADYSEFLRLFPRSRFAERIQKSLEEAQAGYKAAYPSERGRQIWGETLNALQSIEEWDVTVTLKESGPSGRAIVQRSVGRGTDMRRSESGTGLAISDGKTLWIYDSAKREYTQGPASNGEVLFSGEGLSLFANAVAGLRSELEKLHYHLLLEEKDELWLVEMRFSKDGPPYRWHIDKKRYVPLRIEEPNGIVDIVWRSVNQPVADDLFRFMPPADAKLGLR
jgi:outer membrane lipoprotein-sorting protein